MYQPLRKTPEPVAADLLTFLPDGERVGSFTRFLRSEAKTEGTVEKYVGAVRDLHTFLVREGLSTHVAEIQRAQLVDYMAEVVLTGKASTANTRFYSIKAFFNFLVKDEEIRWHPMDGMSPPPAPAPEVPILDADHVNALLKTCKTNSFEDRRDAALIMMYYDTGARVSELINVELGDVEDGSIRVLGKGSKYRTIHFGAATGRALDRYIRARERHELYRHDRLWLGTRGPMTRSGVRSVLDRRAKAAGVGHIHPHQFRHTFAHQWLADGGQENDLMRLTGWSSRTMVGRYAASAADARAAENYRKRQSPADKLKGK